MLVGHEPMIAISYRREDSLPIAGRLYDRLQAKFGKKNVFMDFDSIPPGVDFREHIHQTIQRSNLVIVVIGSGWLGEQGEGPRRIDDANDFVHLEIAYALKAQIPIIPVLVNNTQMPKPEKLPSDIQGLAFRNALPLDAGIDFHQHVDRLIAGIGKLAQGVRKRRGLVAASDEPKLHRAPDSPESRVSNVEPGKKRWQGSNVWTAVAVILLTAAAAMLTWHFAAHRHTPPASESNKAFAALEPKPLSAEQPSLTVASKPVAAPSEPPRSVKLTKVYVRKYGVSALLPTDVFPEAKKLSDSDQYFLQGNSWSGLTTLTFSAVREPLAKVYAECATEHSPQAPSKTVQYKVLKSNWFVVSGDLGPEADASIGFYTKGVKKDTSVILMHFQWREDDFPFSQETFAAMSRGFDGN
jgi:TIR domain-containing protein